MTVPAGSVRQSNVSISSSSLIVIIIAIVIIIVTTIVIIDTNLPVQ